MANEGIHIAIIGGSLGGCSLALGLHLLQRTDITFDVFEAWSFSERGAGVGVHPNGQNALRELGVDADALLQRAGAFREHRAGAEVAYGEHEGKALCTIPGGVQAVLRITLLDEMVKLLPAERLHANKKLVSIDEASDRLLLRFSDDSTYSADAVVGCDGLHSTVRGFILGRDDPSVSPKFTGYWDARAFMSAEETRQAWGDEIIQHDNPREYFKVGNGCCMLFASAPEGHLGGVVAAGVVESESERQMLENSKLPLTREFLEGKFCKWDKGYVQGVIGSLLDPKAGPGVLFAEYESQEVSKWCRGKICMMGDAAHGALPWLGQGFSMAAEDAAIMTRLLDLAKSRQDLAKAFRAFNEARNGTDSRPRFVQKNAKTMAALCSGQMGLDPERAAQVVETVPRWFAHLWDVDMKKEVEKAIDCFKCSN